MSDEEKHIDDAQDSTIKPLPGRHPIHVWLEEYYSDPVNAAFLKRWNAWIEECRELIVKEPSK